MGFFHDDKEGSRRALVRTTTADVAKQTSKFTDVASAALIRRPVGGIVDAIRRNVTRKAEVADIEAAVQISAAVSKIQDNVIHMQTGFARGVNEVKRLQNESARLDLEFMEIERQAEQIARQNQADATTAPILMKASHLAAETTRLEALADAVRVATRLGINPAYLYDQDFGVDVDKAIPVVQVEKEYADHVFEKERVHAKIADQQVSAEGDLYLKKKKVHAERMTPVGASADELPERAHRIVQEALDGIVEPHDPNRYLNAYAGAIYYQQLIEGASFLSAKKIMFEAVLLALKQDLRGERKTTREMALVDLRSYFAKKEEYERLTQAAGIGDLIEQVSGGRSSGDPFN